MEQRLRVTHGGCAEAGSQSGESAPLRCCGAVQEASTRASTLRQKELPWRALNVRVLFSTSDTSTAAVRTLR